MSDNYFIQLRLHTPDVIFRFEMLPERRYAYMSPSSAQVTGYTPEEFYADPMLGYKIIHPDDLPVIEKEISSMTREQNSRVPLRWIARDGRIVFTEQYTVPVFDDQDRLIAVEGLTRDVTEKRQIEMEIRRQKDLLAVVESISNTGGWEFYPDTGVVYWTEGVFRIHGLPLDYSPSNIPNNISFYQGESGKIIEKAFKDACTMGIPYEIESPFISADGRERWVKIIGKPIVENGKIIRLIGNIVDITAVKQAELEIRESERKLVALNQQIDQLREDERRTIAHEIHDELGQLLSVMNLDLNMLLKKTRSADRREILYQLLSINKEAIETVRRIATDLHPSILEQLGLIPAMEWLLREFAKRTGWTYHCTLPDAAFFRPGYPGSIGFYRIVQESLTNIARYANAARVELKGNIEGSRFFLSITDNGIGFNYNTLSEKDLFGIFGMQQRALALGATLNINTRPGHGTTVNFSAPYISETYDKEYDNPDR